MLLTVRLSLDTAKAAAPLSSPLVLFFLIPKSPYILYLYLAQDGGPETATSELRTLLKRFANGLPRQETDREGYPQFYHHQYGVRRRTALRSRNKGPQDVPRLHLPSTSFTNIAVLDVH